MIELWDAYDSNFNKIEGVELIRGDDIPDGMFHLVSEIIVKHIDGSYLLMQRDPNKHYGLMWEATAGGSVLKGESELAAAKRELFEETGIASTNLMELGRIVHYEHKSLYVEYLCVTDCDKNSIKLQEGETVDFRWVNTEQFKALGDILATTRIQKFITELKN